MIEISVPENVSRLYTGNKEIDKIYQLLDSGQPLRALLSGEILAQLPPGNVNVATENPKEGLSQPIEPDDECVHCEISDCVPETNQPHASDIPQTRVAGTAGPGFGRRLLAVASVLALIAVTASASLYVGWHLANRRSGPATEAQVPVTRESAPAIDQKSTNSSDISTSIPKPPPDAVPVSSPPPPDSAGDNLALAPQAMAANECDVPISRMTSDQITICRQFVDFWNSLQAQGYQPTSSQTPPTVIRPNKGDDQSTVTIMRPRR